MPMQMLLQHGKSDHSVAVNISSTSFRLVDTCLSHEFAGKGVLNILVEFYQSDICRFRAMTLLSLHLVVNWQVFTVNICCFITKM